MVRSGGGREEQENQRSSIITSRRILLNLTNQLVSLLSTTLLSMYMYMHYFYCVNYNVLNMRCIKVAIQFDKGKAWKNMGTHWEYICQNNNTHKPKLGSRLHWHWEYVKIIIHTNQNFINFFGKITRLVLQCSMWSLHNKLMYIHFTIITTAF